MERQQLRIVAECLTFHLVETSFWNHGNQDVHDRKIGGSISLARCAKRRRSRRDRPAIRRPVLANAEFNVLFDDGTVYEAACWAHARRKFFDLHEARPSALTAEAPRRIAKLYVIEAEIRGKPPHE